MLEAFGLTDQGCVRANNEDYFIVDRESGIFVLADGMGGAKAGEYASRLSSERLYESLLRPHLPPSLDTLEFAFAEANEAVREAARGNPEFEGMGTTLVAARISENGAQVASVGDSRAYLSSPQSLSPLTRDQTWVAEVGQRLGLDDQALRNHPMRHVLTMAVGTTDQLRVQAHEVAWATGDHLLLCSDGLHGVLSEDFLQQTLICEKNLEEKAHYLVDAAKNAGGPDNITLVLVRLP